MGFNVDSGTSNRMIEYLPYKYINSLKKKPLVTNFPLKVLLHHTIKVALIVLPIKTPGKPINKIAGLGFQAQNANLVIANTTISGSKHRSYAWALLSVFHFLFVEENCNSSRVK